MFTFCCRVRFSATMMFDLDLGLGLALKAGLIFLRYNVMIRFRSGIRLKVIFSVRCWVKVRFRFWSHGSISLSVIIWFELILCLELMLQLELGLWL